MSGFDHHDPEIEAMMDARARAQGQLPEARARRLVFGEGNEPVYVDFEAVRQACERVANAPYRAAVDMVLFGQAYLEVERSPTAVTLRRVPPEDVEP